MTLDQSQIHKKMKKAIFPLIILLTLTGCSDKPDLRKDISDFISHFSLSESMEAYKSGGYISTRVDTTGEKALKTVVELEYSRVDQDHPTYVEVTTNYEDDVETSKVEVRFVESEGSYYISTNGELKPSSLKECNNLITKFFYKEVGVDGNYHTQGFYYGDYLKVVAPVLQNWVTIDQQNELYIYDISVTKVIDGLETTVSENYSINKLGMAVENHNYVGNETGYIEQDIYIHN